MQTIKLKTKMPRISKKVKKNCWIRQIAFHERNGFKNRTLNVVIVPIISCPSEALMEAKILQASVGKDLEGIVYVALIGDIISLQ